MSYRIKRVDPFWLKSPALPAAALVAAAGALFAAKAGQSAFMAASAAACGISVFLATKPALSGVFAVFGLLGGAVTFLASPGSGLSPAMRVLATAGFSLFYMVLMDGVVLAVSMIYNLFARAGLGGFRLELENQV